MGVGSSLKICQSIAIYLMYAPVLLNSASALLSSMNLFSSSVTITGTLNGHFLFAITMRVFSFITVGFEVGLANIASLVDENEGIRVMNTESGEFETRITIPDK